MVLAKPTLRQYEEDSHSTTSLPQCPLTTQDLADDKGLAKLQLKCSGVLVGNRSPEDSLNTAMLQNAHAATLSPYYNELTHFVSAAGYCSLETRWHLLCKTEKGCNA